MQKLQWLKFVTSQYKKFAFLDKFLKRLQKRNISLSYQQQYYKQSSLRKHVNIKRGLRNTLIYSSIYVCGLGCTSKEDDVIDSKELKKLIKSGKATVIDVRETIEACETGSISNSINIPSGCLKEFMQLSPEAFYEKYQKNKPDKDALIVICCKNGDKSQKASRILKDLGYSKVKILKGGYEAWLKEN